jgi:MerR family transcriptional regulator, repressor of the yfmOP operon
MSREERWYRIDEAAEETGLTKRTIRYYEELGLLPPAVRSEGNYRLLSRSDIDRLTHIVRLKEALGIPLSEMQQLLAAEEEQEQLIDAYRRESDSSLKQEHLQRIELLLREQITRVDERIRRLAEVKAELERKLTRCALQPSSNPTSQKRSGRRRPS